MKGMIALLRQWIAFVVVAMAVTPLMAFAQEAATQVAGTLAVAQAEPGLDVIFEQVMRAIGDWRAIGWQAGLAAALTALVSTMKNSFLRGLIWSKVPEYLKILVAPVVAILCFGLAMGKDFSMLAFWAAASTGVLAVYFHQVLDALKKAPYIGEKWKWLIDLVGKFFKKPEAPPAPDMITDSEVKEAKEIDAQVETK